MPLQKLEFRPGINREGTDYANEGGWYDGNKIRFRSGFPEKIGGWTLYSSATYLGTARSLWNWTDLSGNSYIGLGTNVKYYINQGGTYFDVTPYVYTPTFSGTSTLTNTITATTGLSSLQIVDTNYTPSVGDYIVITGATSLGGNITAAVLNQEYQEVTSVSGTTYTINAKDPTTGLPVLATSSDTGHGGTYTISYEVPIGLDVYTIGIGWGAGPWSRGGWGTGYTSGGIGQQLRLWSNDNFGQDLVIAPRGGAIYYWKASTGTSTRAQSLNLLSTTAGYSGAYVPYQTNQVVTSAIQEFVIAFGANSYINGTPASPFNPMLVRWSDQANQYQWVPSVTNQSGEFPLTNGSYIMGARATRQEILVWTDTCLYSMQYIGAPYVWGFQILMDNISVMSPNSMITVNNVTYWMGVDKFYMYSGRVETLPCSLRQYIFNDINLSQAYQVFAGANPGFNEVWWFYVSNDTVGSTIIDKYVIYNYVDRVWYYGTMGRTAWLDYGSQYPIAATYNNNLVQHENGVDDASTSNPVAINAYVQSSDFDIQDGHNFGFVWRILPDINFNGSNVSSPQVTMTVVPRQNAGSAYGVADNPTVISAGGSNTYNGTPKPFSNNVQTYNIQQFTGQVYTRLRGRQLSFRIESNQIGCQWQLGLPRIDIRPDGRR
jgi:hypothetical protein